jgi:hypothetical protein
MVGLPEATWSKDEDGESYLHSSNDIQDPKRCTISDLQHKSLAITISFVTCTSSVSLLGCHKNVIRALLASLSSCLS